MPDSVLVVDDDPLVLEMLDAVLPCYGFAVHKAAGGQQALDLYRTHRGSIGVVLLDLKMPGLSGPQTLAALRGVDPDLGCVFMSGYSAEEALPAGADRVVQKPFLDLNELAGVLREAARPS
jgi:CheY-like chemotaxis protein